MAPDGPCAATSHWFGDPCGHHMRTASRQSQGRCCGRRCGRQGTWFRQDLSHWTRLRQTLGWRHEATAVPAQDGSLVSCSGAEDRAIPCSLKENEVCPHCWIKEGRRAGQVQSRNILILLHYKTI